MHEGELWTDKTGRSWQKAGFMSQNKQKILFGCFELTVYLLKGFMNLSKAVTNASNLTPTRLNTGLTSH